MCPMDSIEEFIFVFNGKASRVNDCMSSLLWLCLQLHPSARTNKMDWLVVGHGWPLSGPCISLREVDSSTE